LTRFLIATTSSISSESIYSLVVRKIENEIKTLKVAIIFEDTTLQFRDLIQPFNWKFTYLLNNDCYDFSSNFKQKPDKLFPLKDRFVK